MNVYEASKMVSGKSGFTNKGLARVFCACFMMCL